MGLSDRDWYREEVRKRERWQHPLSAPVGYDKIASDRHLLIATWIVVIAAAVGVSLAANKWRQHSSERLASKPPTQAIQIPIAPIPYVQSAPTLPPEAAETRQVAKCIVNGRVSYSTGADCRNGTVATVQVNPSRSEVEGGF